MYLDADMLVLRSIDGLFDLPPGFYAGVLCCAVLCCAVLCCAVLCWLFWLGWIGSRPLATARL